MSNMQRIVLNMIVKNEAHVIERCLASVKPLITEWCIVDTGSTDGTQDVIRNFMADIPGTLHERPWVDQQTNRNEALDLAVATGAEYAFLIDADEEMLGAKMLPTLTHDSHTITVSMSTVSFARHMLLRLASQWRWVSTGKRCKFHPMLKSPVSKTTSHITGMTNLARPDGGSHADPNKYKRLVPLVDLDIADDPDNARLVYYGAQNCRDAGELNKALTYYTRRAEMGGWVEEAWSAKYEAAKVTERLQRPTPEVVEAYLAAFTMRPTRAEPLWQLSRYCRERRDYTLAKQFSLRGIAIEKPRDILFVEHDVYIWKMKNELACAQWRLGEFEDATTTFKTIDFAQVPEHALPQLRVNAAYFGVLLER